MESIMTKNGWLKNKLYFHILTDRVNDEDRENFRDLQKNGMLPSPYIL